MPTPVHLRGNPILRRLTTERPNVAEIGVLVGALSCYLLQKRQGLYLVCVDLWGGAEDHSEEYKATGDAHAMRTAEQGKKSRNHFYRFMRSHLHRTTVLPLPSVEAAQRINDGSLDMVFIDADHSLQGVRADIRAWMPKIMSGGYIGGHDYSHPDPKFRFGVKQAVDEFVAESGLELELDNDMTWFVRLL